MIFQCPDCKGSLESTYSSNILKCRKCEEEYKIVISIIKLFRDVKELNERSSKASDI
jgi:uncharacterized protein YbaR (Trm112 family)